MSHNLFSPKKKSLSFPNLFIAQFRTQICREPAANDFVKHNIPLIGKRLLNSLIVQSNRDKKSVICEAFGFSEITRRGNLSKSLIFVFSFAI